MPDFIIETSLMNRICVPLLKLYCAEGRESTGWFPSPSADRLCKAV